MRSARFCSHNRDLSQVISLSHPLLSVLGVEKLRGWDKLLSKPRNRRGIREPRAGGRTDVFSLSFGSGARKCVAETVEAEQSA